MNAQLCPTTRVCTVCKEPQPETEFKLQMARGKLYRKTECVTCNRARQRKYWHDRAAPQPKVRVADPLNLLANRWRGRVNRKEPLRWRA